MNDNVKAIVPKRVYDAHRGKKFSLQFIPRDRRVIWIVPWTVLGTTILFHDYNSDFAHARRSAVRKIDQLIDGKP